MTLENARAIARFLPDCAILVKRLLGDPRIPRRTKILLGVALPYLASPIDLVPDSVPVLGQLDDALVLAVVGAYVVRTAGRDVVAELWPGSEEGLSTLTSLVGDAKLPLRELSRRRHRRPTLVHVEPPSAPPDDPFARELDSVSWDLPRPNATEPRKEIQEAAPVTLEGPTTPELMLVAPPEVAQLARRRLPEPEPLDEWLLRMRFEETQRAIRAHLELVKARQQRAAERRASLRAGAFAAAATLASVLPVLGFLLGL